MDRVRGLLVTTLLLITDGGHSPVHLPPGGRSNPQEHGFVGEARHTSLFISKGSIQALPSCLSARGTLGLPLCIDRESGCISHAGAAVSWPGWAALLVLCRAWCGEEMSFSLEEPPSALAARFSSDN